MRFQKKYLPNFITCLRIAGAVALPFLPPFTAAFYAVYTFCGLTDALDGMLARRLSLTSELGAQLDSVADLLFYSAMLWHVVPALWTQVPAGVWFAVGGVLLLRLCAYLVAGVKYHLFASQHTYFNKVTGAAVFLFPYFMTVLDKTTLCAVVCAIGGLASLEELLIHLTSPTYRSNRKTIFENGERKDENSRESD